MDVGETTEMSRNAPKKEAPMPATIGEYMADKKLRLAAFHKKHEGLVETDLDKAMAMIRQGGQLEVAQRMTDYLQARLDLMVEDDFIANPNRDKGAKWESIGAPAQAIFKEKFYAKPLRELEDLVRSDLNETINSGVERKPEMSDEQYQLERSGYSRGVDDMNRLIGEMMAFRPKR